MKMLALVFLAICASTVGAQSTCTANSTTACLIGDRFQVEVDYDTSGSAFVAPGVGTPSGSAQVVAQAGFPTDATAPFTFYDADQVDALVQVLDGCPVNGHYWVFIAAATDAATTVDVTDTATGASVQYVGPSGQAFVPTLDTTAFQTCDAGTASGEPVAMPAEPRGACGAAFCLQGGRYALDIAFNDNGSNSGDAVSALATDHSGVGFLFNDQRPEIVSTLIDGRADNGAFWFLSSAITQLELIYTLTDTTTSLTNVYVKSFGSALTLLDRGHPVSASITGPQSATSPGQPATYRLTLNNSAPTERAFSASIPTPTGASNPAFACTALNGAVCPNASGTGAFNESGSLVAGGELIYDYSVTVAPARGGAAQLVAEATVTTAAHALAAEGSVVVSASAPIAEAESVPIPVDSRWMLLLLALGLVITAVHLRR